MLWLQGLNRETGGRPIIRRASTDGTTRAQHAWAMYRASRKFGTSTTDAVQHGKEGSANKATHDATIHKKKHRTAHTAVQYTRGQSNGRHEGDQMPPTDAEHSGGYAPRLPQAVQSSAEAAEEPLDALWIFQALFAYYWQRHHVVVAREPFESLRTKHGCGQWLPKDAQTEQQPLLPRAAAAAAASAAAGETE